MRIIWCFFCLLFLSANAFGQSLLWEVVEDFSGSDVTRALTLSKKAATFIGNVGGADGVDFVVQSLSRTNGSVRWTDRVPTNSGFSTGLQIASSQGRVFAAGYLGTSPFGDSDIVVRAYDALTGTLLWNSVWDEGANDLPQSIVAGPSAVVVVGWGGNNPEHARQFIVRAYDPIDGAVLWEDLVERSDVYTIATTDAISGQRVFVAGHTAEGDLLVRAYDAFSGALLWEITRPLTRASVIKAVSGRVFLAGTSGGRGYVGAFKAKSGALLWEDDATLGAFSDIAIQSNRLVAAGTSGSALFVRAYDVSTGGIDWQDQPSVLPGFEFERATAVALNNQSVYIAGNRVQSFGQSEFVVRSYDAVAGTLLWDDRSHPSSSPPGASVVDMALGKNRLFVAGWAVVGARIDFVIRAYDARRHGTGSALVSEQ